MEDIRFFIKLIAVITFNFRKKKMYFFLIFYVFTTIHSADFMKSSNRIRRNQNQQMIVMIRIRIEGILPNHNPD